MTPENDSVGDNDKAPGTSGAVDSRVTQGCPHIVSASGISSPSSTTCQCQITCKTEKDFWDNVKTCAEIIGIFLLAIYTAYTIKMYCANKKAADAAESAAGTAKEAIHISERAYLTIGDPQLDFEGRAIYVAVNNSGRIPSGPVDVVIHEATTAADPRQSLTNLSAATERHWRSHHFNSAPSGSPFLITIRVPAMSKEKLDGGFQEIIVAGFVSYNDGFPDTQSQKWLFCANSTYHNMMKRLFLTPCDADVYLPRLESLDGYPNNEQK